jgi:propanediol dehydratase large subunit
MTRKLHAAGGVAAVAAILALANPAAAAGVKVGVLTCHVSSGWGFVFGSSKDLHCNFSPSAHMGGERYAGTVSKFGVDVGYTAGGVLVWDVIAPTSSMKRGALAGAYAGATASATVGVGAGANVLVGGFNRSITLQPLSIEGNTGLNVAAGIGEITLHFEAPEMMMGPPPGEPPPPPPG